LPDRSDAARRARGLRVLKAWLPEESLRKLDELAEDSAFSRAEMVDALIDYEYDEWQRLKASGARRKRSRAG
jgi:hypothetical protein